jgi:conjugative transfer signal peptidase TraF
MIGAAVPAAALLATLLWRPTPRFVWNASASSPIGLYRITDAAGIRRGEMAIAWPPAAARALGAERRYLPANVPLVKRVAAAAGDRVCARGAALFVNDRKVAVRRRADPSGRALPWWTGCERLRGGDLLLLSAAVPEAFDGRYFGVSRRELIVGRARLVWPR